FLAFTSVKNQIFDRLRQFGKRRLEAETIMLPQAVEPAPTPGIFVVIERFLHDRAIAQTAAGIRHEERWMYALGRSQTSASAARASRIIKGKIAVVQRGGNEVMFPAAETLPK